VKSFARLTARLDQAICVAWFGTGVLFAASRTHFLLEAFYMAGGPQVPFAWVEGLRAVWATLTGVVTLAYVANVVACWRRGTPPNPVKLFGLVTSLAFWMYCCLVVKNLLVGILMFEIFHDVQYLTIVWLFNRKRALTAPASVGKATRALFGQSQARAVFYVGLVMAYGSLYFLEMAFKHWKPVESAGDTPVWGGILAASGLLHFYYDGFIWKEEKPPTCCSGSRADAVGRWPADGGTARGVAFRRAAQHHWMPLPQHRSFRLCEANPAMSASTAHRPGRASRARSGAVEWGWRCTEGDLEGAIGANRRFDREVERRRPARANRQQPRLGLIERSESSFARRAQAGARAREA
jgi:hypothetical protein